MKTLSIAVIALVVGMVLGSWEKRLELQKAHEKISFLSNELTDMRQKNKNRTTVTEVTRMLHNLSSGTTSKTQPETKLDNTSDVDVPQPSPTWNEDEQEMMRELASAQSPVEMLKISRELWEIRSAHAKELLRENLDLTDQEMQDFENILNKMNATLKDQLEHFADSVDDIDEDITTEMTMGLIHDITGTLLDTYREVNDIFPEDWQWRTSDETDLLGFIDPMVAMPFARKAMDSSDFDESEE